MTDLFKEGETIGTAAVVIQVQFFAHVYFLIGNNENSEKFSKSFDNQIAFKVAGASLAHQHSYSILVTGIARFYLTKLLKEFPHPIALVEAIDENALVEGKTHYGTLILYSR